MKRLSQRELAELAGTSQTGISKWEREVHSPNPGDFIRLARILDTTPEWLAFGHRCGEVGGEGNDHADSPDDGCSI